MAQFTLIDGSIYNIKSGKTLVNGAGYSIMRGKALIAGTGYTIGVSDVVLATVTLWIDNPDYNAGGNGYIYVNGILKGTAYVDEGTAEGTCSVQVKPYIDRVSIHIDRPLWFSTIPDSFVAETQGNRVITGYVTGNCSIEAYV